MAYYVDTHCHLDLIKDIKQTIDREDGDLIKTITVTNTPALLSPIFDYLEIAVIFV